MSSELKFNSEIKNQTSELYNKIHLSIPQI